MVAYELVFRQSYSMSFWILLSDGSPCLGVSVNIFSWKLGHGVPVAVSSRSKRYLNMMKIDRLTHLLIN